MSGGSVNRIGRVADARRREIVHRDERPRNLRPTTQSALDRTMSTTTVTEEAA
jgi:hypothetical protein